MKKAASLAATFMSGSKVTCHVFAKPKNKKQNQPRKRNLACTRRFLAAVLLYSSPFFTSLKPCAHSGFICSWTLASQIFKTTRLTPVATDISVFPVHLSQIQQCLVLFQRRWWTEWKMLAVNCAAENRKAHPTPIHTHSWWCS